MLQVIRDRAQGVIVWIIVGAIVLSFALVGVNDYLTGDNTGFNAAIVNEQDVSLSVYSNAYQRELQRYQQMFGERFDVDMFDDQIKKAALERAIEDELVTQLALGMDLRVGNQALSAKIQQFENFQQDGIFSTAEYESQLRNAGYSPASFEARIRRSMLADQLLMGVAGSGFATQAEIESVYRLSEQERNLAFVTVSSSQFKAKIKPGDDEIKSHYELNSGRYQTEEKISVDYLEIARSDLTKDISLEEGELEEFYEDQKSRFIAEQEIKASHILILVDEDVSNDKAKTEIDDLAAKIKAGADFSALAKKHSKDPGSAELGGDLGWFGKGVMDAAFEEAAFSLLKGEVSSPVRSEFGWHLIRLDDVKSSGGKSFAEVKDDLEKELKKQKAEKNYIDQTEKLANLTYENPESLVAAAESLGLEIKSTDLFGRAGGPGIARNQKITQAAFSAEVIQQDMNSEAIEVGDSTIVLRKKEYIAAATRPLDEVKSQVVQEIKNNQAKEKARELGSNIEQDLKAGSSLAKLAKKHKLKLTDFAWHKRSGSSADAQIVRKAFSVGRKSGENIISGFAQGNGDYTVLVVKDVRDGDVAKMTDDERTTYRQGQANASGFGEYSTMVETLKAQATIKRFPENL